MIKVGYSQEFFRAFNKLSPALQEEIEEKIELFKNRRNHHQLRVHKLHGEYVGCWSFSVNYRFRVMFAYVGKDKSNTVLVSVGDHSIYD